MTDRIEELRDELEAAANQWSADNFEAGSDFEASYNRLASAIDALAAAREEELRTKQPYLPQYVGGDLAEHLWELNDLRDYEDNRGCFPAVVALHPWDGTRFAEPVTGGALQQLLEEKSD